MAFCGCSNHVSSTKAVQSNAFSTTSGRDRKWTSSEGLSFTCDPIHRNVSENGFKPGHISERPAQNHMVSLISKLEEDWEEVWEFGVNENSRVAFFRTLTIKILYRICAITNAVLNALRT